MSDEANNEIIDEMHHIYDLIKDHKARLRIRERQAAQQGISTDPSILIEIEVIESKVRELNKLHMKGFHDFMKTITLDFEWELDELQRKSTKIATRKRELNKIQKRISKLDKTLFDTEQQIEIDSIIDDRNKELNELNEQLAIIRYRRKQLTRNIHKMAQTVHTFVEQMKQQKGITS